jgi:hypothetical protein
LINLGEPTVVLGKITRQYVIKERPPCPTPTDEEKEGGVVGFVCIDAWIGFDISTSATLAGPKIAGRIRAARIQHSKVKSFQSSKLFVLRPIEDALMRKAIKANFYLVDLSAPDAIYCLQGDPKKYGLKDFDAAAPVSRGTDDSRYCFELKN